MIKYYFRTIKDKKLLELETFRVGSWIYVENPDDDEIAGLAKKFSLEIGHLKDAVDPSEVPRFEKESGAVYVFTRIPFEEGKRIVTLPFLVVETDSFVLTLCMKPLPFLQKLIEGRKELFTTQKAKLILLIFSEISARYTRFVNSISRSIRGSSVKLERIDNRDIIQFVYSEEMLHDFLSALVPTNSILNSLVSSSGSANVLVFHENDKDIIEDLLLGNGQLIETCNVNLKNIVNIREAYSTIMTNNLNRVIKLLTMVTVVLTIPMIISSFYGMNINLPMAKDPNLFWYLLAITGFIILLIFFIFRKNRWF